VCHRSTAKLVYEILEREALKNALSTLFSQLIQGLHSNEFYILGISQRTRVKKPRSKILREIKVKIQVASDI
jgi:hypothetical protein